MRISSRWLRKQIAGGLVMMLAAPFAQGSAASPGQSPIGQPAQSVSSVQSQPEGAQNRAVKPSPDTSGSKEAYPDNPDPARSQDTDRSGQSGTSQPAAQQAQEGASKPVGTAAAPYEKTTGVAASRPAGAVIAPAKQRRARALLIRVGVIVGAAVAVGTVLALTHGSPSKPN
jgi:hypothetical protein